MKLVEHNGDQGGYNPDTGNVARFVVFGAFGEILARFQVLELAFWGILAHRQKRGMTLEQRMGKIEGWNRGVLGNLVAAADLPAELDEEAHRAVEARNYLVHRFMRDRMPFLHDAAFCEQVGTELAKVSSRLDDFETALGDHTRALGVPEVTDDELSELGLANPDPNLWFS
ncbi:hypothetical protein [Umezawaea sp. Da 62-37]|uniref:hypothetical protein n=1 Tax=Umezawaea sp. Da 62-37 TaxID=3075927 RepID=UPI0028F70F60|nr:hypothetical protein [Umezawaea sp. Da 62-37]WNV83190.1 hypothetical protein RM788_34085 [Umezawaea sp. Da 62-37]